MSGIPEATIIVLTAAERTELEGLARSTKTQHRLRQRARIVLLAAGGMASRAIGREVRCTTGTASKRRVRYAQRRRAGLDETGDRGAEPKYTSQTDTRILALLDQPPPKGYGRWTGPLLAAGLGDVDVQYIWRLLRAQKIDLAGRKSWCESNDPQFAAKAADVVGLYMAPPENAVVICVDEKPFDPGAGAHAGIPQASERAGADRSKLRLQAQRHLDAVRRLRGGHRQGDHLP
jgi:transposase